jgi:hypothetical protein
MADAVIEARQVFSQGIEFRECKVDGRSELIAELAHPFF